MLSYLIYLRVFDPFLLPIYFVVFVVYPSDYSFSMLSLSFYLSVRVFTGGTGAFDLVSVNIC